MRQKAWSTAGLLLVAVAGAAVIDTAAPNVVAVRTALPVVSPVSQWEGRNVAEPNVWRQGGRWHMLFSGGWEAMAIGHATAPTVDGPWTQDPDPVLGLGRGGWANSAREPSLLVDHGTLYVYFSPTTEPGSRHACDLMLATGTDVRHLRVLKHPALRPFGAAQAIVNVSVVRDRRQYRMLFESRIARSATWAMGYAVGASPASFKPVAFPLPSLRRGGAYGGPDLHRAAHEWMVLYHAAPVEGALPTDIYRATSTDLIHWSHVARLVEHPAGADQAADPFLAGGRLFYAVMNNLRRQGAIQAVQTSMTAGP